MWIKHLLNKFYRNKKQMLWCKLDVEMKWLLVELLNNGKKSGNGRKNGKSIGNETRNFHTDYYGVFLCKGEMKGYAKAFVFVGVLFVSQRRTPFIICIIIGRIMRSWKVNKHRDRCEKRNFLFYADVAAFRSLDSCRWFALSSSLREWFCVSCNPNHCTRFCCMYWYQWSEKIYQKISNKLRSKRPHQ